MLGNFSFGDYFKPDAIRFAHELLIKGYAIDPNRLVYTVHHSDNDARQLWKKVAGVGDDRVLGLVTGQLLDHGRGRACGPCSEFTTTRGRHPLPRSCGRPPLSGAGVRLRPLGPKSGTWWFMQFEQLPDRTRRPLAQTSVDTGMGLNAVCRLGRLPFPTTRLICCGP